MPLPGDSQPGAEDLFVFGPGAPPAPEETVPPADHAEDLWASLLVRWMAAVEPPADLPPSPADDPWGS